MDVSALPLLSLSSMRLDLLASSCMVLASFSIIIWLTSANRSTLEALPGPKSYPLIGIGLSLPRNAPEVLRMWASQYGEVYKIRVGWFDWVIINSPEAVKEILDKQSIHTSSKAPLPYGHDIVSNGKRMFTMSYGSRWRTYRTILHKLLSTTTTMTFLPSQEFEVKQLLYEIANMNQNEKDFYYHVRRTSLSIISTSTLGRRIGSKDHEDIKRAGQSSQLLGTITRAGAFIEDEVPPLLLLPRWLQPSYYKAHQFADILRKGKLHIWDRLKAEVMSGTIAPCFGTELLDTDYKSQGLDEEDAAWIVGGVVEAGSETTSVTLLNLILYLAVYPEVQAIAHAELLKVCGPSRSPVYNDIASLTYIRSCVKEVLRLNPVPTLGIKHYADKPVKYKDYIIPAGTILLANTAGLHRDPKRYSEPDSFRPERYLNHPRSSAEYAAAAVASERDHFTFGVGRRICPGIRLAENSLHLAVANLIWAFEIKPPLVNGMEAKMDISDAAFDTAAAFRPPKPFQARFIPRSEEIKQQVSTDWETARAQGYTLRGVKIES